MSRRVHAVAAYIVHAAL